MQEVGKILIGIIILFLAFPIGDFLRSKTKDELKQGKPWLILIIYTSLLGGLVGLMIGLDWLLFTSFFIAIVTSRSLKKEKKNGKTKEKKREAKK